MRQHQRLPHPLLSGPCRRRRPPLPRPLQVVQAADVIFVAVKPQYVGVVLREVAPHLQDRHTIVSIAAGITLQSLKVWGARGLLSRAAGWRWQVAWERSRQGQPCVDASCG